MLLTDRPLIDWWLEYRELLKKMNKSRMTLNFVTLVFWEIRVMFPQTWKTETKICMSLLELS